MKKLPKGISNYEELIEDGYYYVDKTMYIEKLENLEDKRIMFLRPRKFGKTLFTSVLENYYDILKENKFDKLFKETYIGKNPTHKKNEYHILKFNFSGIDTENTDSTIRGFKSKVQTSIESFAKKYKIEFIINENQESEEMLNSILTAFKLQKEGEKIYVIIDEYDHFANELLGFHTEDFKNLVSQNGKVRKWYEILKEGTETVVDRIFITGVAPITLDSLTSGFNISSDITRDEQFNEMVGFNQNELIELMKEQNLSKEAQEELLPIMKENYDGYKFSLHSEKHMYNSNMCLYLLSDYVRLNRLPESLIDVNIASDYTKLGKMLDLCKGEEREKVIETTVSGEGIVSDITDKFNPAIGFTEKDLISMLYYLGYLTIDEEFLGKPRLKIPNTVMKEIYSSYFIEILREKTDLELRESDYNEILEEIALHGKIDKLVELSANYLNHLSNRDFSRFDEKYVKLIFYCIVANLKMFVVKSEVEMQRDYSDLLIFPRDMSKGYNAVLMEFKYIKKEDYEKDNNLLISKQDEARKQLKKYKEKDEIKLIPNLTCYSVVAIVDEIYVEEV